MSGPDDRRAAPAAAVPTRRIEGATFAVVANGAEDSPPAAPLREWLLERGARRVTTIFHPLGAEEAPLGHRITTYEASGRARRRTVHLPSRPPLSYPLDPFVPPAPAAVDLWIGMNNLMAARGLLQRRAGRARTVLYWAIDFVPDRFGVGSPLTRAYDALDRWVCVRADGRFEVSRPALDGRTERHGLDPATMAPARVVPMGAWLSRLPAAADDAHRRRRIVFLGHLVPRMGVGRLIEALGVLRDRGVPFQAQIAGRGPSEAELRAQTTAAGLDEVVRFVGFIDDHREVERFVADGSVAVAPYATDMPNFTRYADPSKLRAYTAAGLPVVLTPVPPNAGELAERGGAQVVPYDAEAIAGALEAALEPAEWLRRHGDALRYSSSFDWGRLLPEALAGVGYG